MTSPKIITPAMLLTALIARPTGKPVPTHYGTRKRPWGSAPLAK